MSDQTPATPDQLLREAADALSARWGSHPGANHAYSLMRRIEQHLKTVPAPATTPTAGLEDRYGHVWTLVPGETDLWWSPCKGIALSRATIDAEAGPLDEVDVVVPPLPAPATVDRDTAVPAADEDQVLLSVREQQVRDVVERRLGDHRGLCAAMTEDLLALLRCWFGPAWQTEDQEQRVAQALTDHPRVSSTSCGCGWGVDSEAWGASHAYHVARAAIAAMREVPRG